MTLRAMPTGSRRWRAVALLALVVVTTAVLGAITAAAAVAAAPSASPADPSWSWSWASAARARRRHGGYAPRGWTSRAVSRLVPLFGVSDDVGVVPLPRRSHAQDVRPPPLLDGPLTVGDNPSAAEIDALLALYNSTGGPRWTDVVGWGSDWTVVPVCTWTGVQCAAPPVVYLWSLQLPGHNLVGPLPDAVCALTRLSSLYIPGNCFSGALPPCLATQLPALQVLNVAAGMPPPGTNTACGFTSRLDTYPFARMPSMQMLTLTANPWTSGTALPVLPPSLLEFEWFGSGGLSDGTFQGPLASLFNASAVPRSLRSLMMAVPLDAPGAGPVPDVVCQLPDMQVLVLVGMGLAGPLPACLGTLTNLTQLQLVGNALNGTLTHIDWEHGLPHLQTLALDDNSFGPGAVLPRLPATLLTLSVANCSLGGDLHVLSDTFQAQYANANLANNQFTGPLPPRLLGNDNLITLYAQANNLSGPIDGPVGVHLQVLDVSRNALSGNLSFLGVGNGAYNLLFATLDSNQFTGVVNRTAFSRLASLQGIDLSDNALHGVVPRELLGLPQLRMVNLSANAFTDYEYFTTNSLLRLLLSHNPLTHVFQLTRDTVTWDALSLAILDLSYAGLNASLDAMMTEFAAWSPFLSSLDVSNNAITLATESLTTGQELLLLDTLLLRNNRLRTAFLSVFRSLTKVDLRGNLLPAGEFDSIGVPVLSDASQQLADDPTGLTCPARYMPLNKYVQNTVQVWMDAVVANYSHCTCPPRQYWALPLHACVACRIDQGYACSTATDEAFAGRGVVTREGFYPVALDSGVFQPGVTHHYPEPRLLECAVPRACNPGSTPTFACADGLDVQSLLCSRCLPDHYPVAQAQCRACPGSYRVLVPLVVALVAVAVLVYAWHLQYQARASALLPIALLWLQVTTFLQEQANTQQYGTDDADGASSSDDTSSRSATLSALNNLWGVQSLVNFRPFAVECVASGDAAGFVAQFWSVFAVICVGYALLAVRYLCLCGRADPLPTLPIEPLLPGEARRSQRRHQNRGSSASAVALAGSLNSPVVPASASASASVASADPFRSVASSASLASVASSSDDLVAAKHLLATPTRVQRFGLVIGFVLDLLYLPATNTLLQTFACERVDGTDVAYLRAYPYVTCTADSAAYRGIVSAAALLFAAYSVGWPLFVCWRLWPHARAGTGGGRLDTCAARHEFGFLYNTIRRELWWWGVGVNYARKLLLTLLLTQLPTRSVWMPLGVFVVLAVSVLGVAAVRPYVIGWESVLEVVLLSLATVTYLESILVGVGRAFFQGVGMATALAVLNALVKGVLACLALRYAVGAVQRYCKRSQHPSSSNTPSDSPYASV